MKKAFSLIESIFALVVLAIIFTFFHLSYLQYSKNDTFLSFYQRLYDEEKDLANEAGHSVKIMVHSLSSLPFLEFQTSFFKLKSLKPAHNEYKTHFKDEESL